MSVIQHRLVYQVLEEEKFVKVIRVDTPDAQRLKNAAPAGIQYLPEFLFTGVFLTSNIRQNIVILVKIGFEMQKIIENRLIKEFRGREYFTREDLFEFYRCFEPDLKEGTFGWRIYDLKYKNIIRPLKRGVYVISYKPRYKPELSPELIKLAKRMTDKFKDFRHCIWETEWLNEFLQHQASKRIILIEIEKDFMDSLYFELKVSSSKELYLNPDKKTIDFYIAEGNYPVVIKKLITRSPTVKRTAKRVNFDTPSLEKILVDLFAEEKLFYYLQGSELRHIYENAISNYAINFTKLFSYAKLRISLKLTHLVHSKLTHPSPVDLSGNIPKFFYCFLRSDFPLSSRR